MKQQSIEDAYAVPNKHNNNNENQSFYLDFAASVDHYHIYYTMCVKPITHSIKSAPFVSIKHTLFSMTSKARH